MFYRAAMGFLTVVFLCSVPASGADQPAFKSLAARDAQREYEQKLAKADKAHQAAVRSALEEYQEELKAAQDLAMERRQLDEANVIQAVIDETGNQRPTADGPGWGMLEGTAWEHTGGEQIVRFLPGGRVEAAGTDATFLPLGDQNVAEVSADKRAIYVWSFTPQGVAKKRKYVYDKHEHTYRLVSRKP